MRRTLLVVGVVAALALAVRGRHHAVAENKAALAVAILKDVAATQGPGISWRASWNGTAATLWQHEPAAFRGDTHRVVVETESWQLELSLSPVFGVTCHVTGGEHGYPEYGFISFLPEHGDVFDALFAVGFDHRSIENLERVCAKHGIPVER